jgi:CHASE3 domain sensor protein
MSLAGQISDTVTAIASTHAARREALSGIRSDTARHLSEARASLNRMASAQQQSLSEALRSTKLATAILIGAADEQIDGYRKERLKRAAALNRELTDGANALRSNIRKWISTQSAVRRKHAADDLRKRRRDRATLGRDIRALSQQNLSFLGALTSDRQEASAIWIGRSVGVAAATPRAKAAPPAKPEPAKPEPVKSDTARPETAHAEAAKPAPVKAEPVKPAPAKAETKSEGKAAHKADKSA